MFIPLSFARHEWVIGADDAFVIVQSAGLTTKKLNRVKERVCVCVCKQSSIESRENNKATSKFVSNTFLCLNATEGQG